MRWVTVLTDHGPRACGFQQGQYIDVNAADPESPSSVRELLALGQEWQLRIWESLPRGPLRHDPESVTLLAPVPDPRKIICLGLNYRDHAAESGVEPPPEPILFSKYPIALCLVTGDDRPAAGEPGGRLRGRACHRGRAGGKTYPRETGRWSTSAATRSATTSRPATGS